MQNTMQKHESTCVPAGYGHDSLTTQCIDAVIAEKITNAKSEAIKLVSCFDQVTGRDTLADKSKSKNKAAF
jgi:hypothetical protein